LCPWAIASISGWTGNNKWQLDSEDRKGHFAVFGQGTLTNEQVPS